jgi:sulfoxide reductase heme-binding subunit YedZ
MAASPASRAFARRWMKPLTLAALTAPFVWLALQWGLGLAGQPSALGFNAGEYTHRFLGDTAISVLLLTLAISPLRTFSGVSLLVRAALILLAVPPWLEPLPHSALLRVGLVALALIPLGRDAGWPPLAGIRRRVGLAAFFYSALHILAYLWLDLVWSLQALWDDVLMRTYITFGMAAFALLIPLAVTSTNRWATRLGRAAWSRLHMLIWPLAILAVLHHFFMVKGDQPEPLVNGAILALLALFRLVARVRRAAARPA